MLKKILKQYLYDCIPGIIIALLWVTVVPIFVVYPPIDHSKSATWIFKAQRLRLSYTLATPLCFALVISRVKRFFAILIDMKQMKKEQELLEINSKREEQFDFIGKSTRICIDMRKSKPNSNIFTLWWDSSISYLNEFMLDTRICSLNDFRRIERKMTKQGKQYRITYLKYSRIITSIQDISDDTVLWSIENIDSQ